jgi:hypothetical protein
MSDAMPKPLKSWGAFLACWALLALVPAAPSYQDGVLSNLSPVGFFYLALSTPAQVPALAWLVLVLHLATSFALMLVVGMARRRLGVKRFRVALAGTAIVSVLGAVWLVRTCWPGGVFFDASTIYYDVSDLVQSPSQPDAPFPSADAVASCVRECTSGAGKHYVPCILVGIVGRPTVIAWGTWTEHYRFRRELAALRRG